MARDEAPPFERGKTFHHDLAPGATIDAATIAQYNHLLGKEWVWEDLDMSDPPVFTTRSGHPVTTRAVRNISGGALLPKRLVTLAAPADSGFTVYGAEVSGNSDVAGEQSFPVDEWLTAAGVPDDDIFWIVVHGPATVLTQLAGDVTNVIAVGDLLVGGTAVTSGATTAGRALPLSQLAAATNTTTALNAYVAANNNVVGKAMSAKTTGQTGADLLVYVCTCI